MFRFFLVECCEFKQIIILGLVPAQAIGGALVSVCSAEYGMRRFDAIKDAFRYSVRISVTSMFIIALSIIALSGPIATVFTLGEGTIHLRSDLQELFVIMAFLLPGFSLVFTGSSLMQALRRAGQAMTNTVFRNILIAVLFAFATYAIADIQWVWYMLVIGEITGGVMMWAHARTVLKDTLRREGKRIGDETRVKGVKTINDVDATQPSEASS